MKTAPTLLLILTIILGSTSIPPAAEPLRGAQAVLNDIATQTGAPAQAAVKPLSETAKLRADLTNFTGRAAQLAPADAAREWLALGDRLLKVPPQDAFGRGGQIETPLQPVELVRALPPPPAWTELAKAIASRPAPAALKDAPGFGLRMLSQALVGDRAAVTAEMAKLEALVLKAKRENAQRFVHGLRALDQALLSQSDDPKAILAGVERQLAGVEREQQYGYSMLNLPDLVSLVGPADAAPLVRRALLSKSPNLSIEGKATKALALKLAMEVVNDLKVARWELVDSIEAVEFYEALENKFNQAKAAQTAVKAPTLDDLENNVGGQDYQKQQAKAYYLMGLIARGRAADAAKFARSLGDEEAIGSISAGEAALAKAGFVRELDNFLHELLTQSPELPFWDPYFAVAARSGRTDRMLQLARTAAAKPELPAARRSTIREHLYRALLAADEVDEGVKELRALLASAPKAPGANARNMMRRNARPVDWQTHALTLARLGLLLEKPEWVNEGLAAVPKADATGGANEFGMQYDSRAYVAVLVQAGRLAEAEQLLTSQLVTQIKQSATQRGYGGMGRAAGLESLKGLVSLYHRAGRHADVLLLLEKSPHWGMKDLAEAFSARSYMEFDFDGMGGGHHGKGPKGNQLALAAAAALVDAGRNPEARAIVDAMLDAEPGDDRAYELLLKLAGQGAIAKLDAVFARDQFEERPLIWKALLLHQAGKNEEAEQVARRAVTIDPSDGEQGKNDRMRVYAVLADVRAARGDAKEAEVLRGAIRAIRLSERADDFHGAGLLRRAVKMYEESLTHFADAYCIQSRLAVQLAELGQHDLAAQHYEKAFTLMPDSFGRVESHCFGCEGAFAGQQAQNVAERVFTTLAAKNPNKPQVHYLLGYLRQQQGREAEALPHFRRALQLDPDYLNAWNHLNDIGRSSRLPAAERDDITFNLVRLDPGGRHVGTDLSSVTDLRRLWTAMAAVARWQVNPPAALLALPASRAELEKKEKAGPNPFNPYGGFYGSYSRDKASSPGQAVAEHHLVQAITFLLNPGAALGLEE